MKEFRDHLARLGRLQRIIERRMEELPDAFNGSVPNGRLRLRAWRRLQDGPPYAVYWILMNRLRSTEFRWQREKPVFPFRRRKIRTRQDLDDAIFFGMACRVRRTVYRYHKQVTALNAAHVTIAKGVEELRKRLHPFRAAAPDEPVDLQYWHGRDFRRCRRLLHGFEAHLDAVQLDLERLDLEMAILPGLPFRLVFEQDIDHPHGRLRWRRIRDGQIIPTLTDRVKRQLRLDPDTSKMLTPYERRRRQGLRRLKAATTVLRHLRSSLPRLLPRALDLARGGGINIPLEHFAQGAVA